MTRRPECSLVNDRPVMIVATPDGGADCVVLDWVSGSFVTDRSYFTRTIPGDFADVDSVTVEEMSSIVAVHRARILRRLAERLAAHALPGHDGEGVLELLGLVQTTPPFDADDMEPTTGPGLMVFAPQELRRGLLDAVLGPAAIGSGPEGTVAATYRVDDPEGGGTCTILALFPSAAAESHAVVLQLALA